MIKNLIVLFILLRLLMQDSAYAQVIFSANAWDAMTNNDRDKEIFSSINYYANSNSITNDFVNHAFSKGLIDDAEKEKMSAGLISANRMGYQFDYGLGYASVLSNGLRIVAGLHAYEHFFTRFNPQAFNLFFYGNSSYAGQSLNLAPLTYTYYCYEKVYGGIEKKLNKSLIMNGLLSIIKGSRFQQTASDRAFFYTSPEGDSLSFDGTMRSAFVSDQKLRMPSCMGFGLSADIGLCFRFPESQSTIRLDIHNLGFIRWNALQSYSANGTYTYTGIEIADISMPQHVLLRNMS